MRGRIRVDGSTASGRRSFGKAEATVRVSASRKRRPGGAGSAKRTGGGTPRAARKKPQSPKDGTSTWYGAAPRPASRRVIETHQNASGAKYGEPAWTARRPPGVR